jgi:hypothetical protein
MSPDHRQHHRPGRVAELVGVIFQNDSRSAIGHWLIHPLEWLDRRMVGVRFSPTAPPPAMHAGLHVRLEDGRHVVAEQLTGSLGLDFRSGLRWTELSAFQARDRGGWDLTVPATVFRGIDRARVHQAVERLNQIDGRPFVGEDCTAFIERSFGNCRLFADSPLARLLGLDLRIGDPALPLLDANVTLDPTTERLLQARALRGLPEPGAHATSPNARLWLRRLVAAIAMGATAGGLLASVAGRLNRVTRSRGSLS